MKHRN